MHEPKTPDSAPNVTLRDVVLEDLPIFFEHQRDPEAARMACVASREREPFFAHWRRILADASLGKQTIVYEGKVVGNVVSFGPESERMVGYWIGREFWGRRIATEALRQYLQIERTRPLYAHVVKTNFGSIRVLEKCGFTVVGKESVADSPSVVVEELVMRLDTCEPAR